MNTQIVAATKRCIYKEITIYYTKTKNRNQCTLMSVYTDVGVSLCHWHCQCTDIISVTVNTDAVATVFQWTLMRWTQCSGDIGVSGHRHWYGHCVGVISVYSASLSVITVSVFRCPHWNCTCLTMKKSQLIKIIHALSYSSAKEI